MNLDRPILRATNLAMTFPNGNGGLRVLEGVDLELFEHEFVCIVGPSGCGKTTLLRILGGLQQPSSGEVCFGDEQIARPRRRIGFVFQQANLMPWRTALENIYLPLELQGPATLQVREQAGRMIDLVGLSGFETSYPRDLSGGMAQRVALARALQKKNPGLVSSRNIRCLQVFDLLVGPRADIQPRKDRFIAV